MLFVAEHTHLASECPLLSAEGKSLTKGLFGDEHIKSAGIEIVGAYMSCPFR